MNLQQRNKTGNQYMKEVEVSGRSVHRGRTDK